MRGSHDSNAVRGKGAGASWARPPRLGEPALVVRFDPVLNPPALAAFRTQHSCGPTR